MMPNKALLLVAHGSRRAASNEEVHALARRLAEQGKDRFGHVQAAFLELCEPNIPEGVEQCLATDCNEVLVLPYFLAAGRHVVDDIPTEVARARIGEGKVRILPHLGGADGMVEMLMLLSEQ